MRVYLIRHAKTVGNAQNRYIGITDSPLCAEGIEFAKNVGRDEELGDVIVTPLTRTQQTASILFPSANQHIADELGEMNFGDFEDRSAADMENDAAYRAWVDGGCMAACPNGESVGGFADRVCAAFMQEVHRAEQNGEERLVFVVHGGVIMALLSSMGVPHKDFYDWYLPNCACVKADVERDAADGKAHLINIEVRERVRLD